LQEHESFNTKIKENTHLKYREINEVGGILFIRSLKNLFVREVSLKQNQTRASALFCNHQLSKNSF
jgi:hypothetical protein